MPRRRKNTTKTKKSLRSKGRGGKSNSATLEKPGVVLDSINVEILKKIISNPNIKSSEIAHDINIPLSTIQRRRSLIETSAILKKIFVVDFHRLGFRIADVLIKVPKGDIENIINHLVQLYTKNILEMTIRLSQPGINLVVRFAYRNNDDLYEMMRTFNKIEHVESIQWSEILKEVTLDKQGLLEHLFSNIKSV